MTLVRLPLDYRATSRKKHPRRLVDYDVYTGVKISLPLDARMETAAAATNSAWTDLLDEIKRKSLEPDPGIKHRVELSGEVVAQLNSLGDKNNAVWSELTAKRRPTKPVGCGDCREDVAQSEFFFHLFSLANAD